MEFSRHALLGLVRQLAGQSFFMCSTRWIAHHQFLISYLDQLNISCLTNEVSASSGVVRSHRYLTYVERAHTCRMPSRWFRAATGRSNEQRSLSIWCRKHPGCIDNCLCWAGVKSNVHASVRCCGKGPGDLTLSFSAVPITVCLETHEISQCVQVQ
jgi:hypothetical protein